MSFGFLRPVLGIVFACASTVGCDRLPYGLEHSKTIEAAPLSSEILAWERRGSKTNELLLLEFSNSRVRRWPCSTNVVIGGRTYEGVLALDSKSFQGKGVLLGAKCGVVIWVGTNGMVELIAGGKNTL